MLNNGNIKVFFINPVLQKTMSAGYNRYLAIVKMVSFNFDYEILMPKPPSFHKIRLLRGFETRLRYILVIFNMLTKSDRKKKKVLYLFGVSPVLSIFFRLFSAFTGVRLICEVNEFPLCVIKNKKLSVFLHKLFVFPWYFKIYNGYSLISNELISFYSKYSNKRILKLLPMTVDFDRFINPDYKTGEKYLFYAGSLNQAKDGIIFLIRAFARVCKEVKDLKLCMAYNTDDNTRIIQNLINELKLQDKIKFLKNVDRKEIPGLLANSLMCVLPRPDSPQARGGFPTKLGEYLASGKPVITTDVGEIPKFLTADEVYFISYRNIEDELTKAIFEILNNYNFALLKAEKGKKKACEQFGLISNSKRIQELIINV